MVAPKAMTDEERKAAREDFDAYYPLFMASIGKAGEEPPDDLVERRILMHRYVQWRNRQP